MDQIIEINVKLIVLGCVNAGKSALVVQYNSGVYTDDVDPTIDDTYRKQVVLDDSHLLVEIIDHSGRDDFSVLRDQWIRDCDSFVVCYAIDNVQSFEIAQDFVHRPHKMKDVDKGDLPMVLVGCKCDLEEKRTVSREEGEQLAKTYGIDFIETSAKLNINVAEAINTVLRKHISKSPNSNNKKTRSTCIVF